MTPIWDTQFSQIKQTNNHLAIKIQLTVADVLWEFIFTVAGMDVLNSAIDKMAETVPAEKWKYVGVGVAPSTITIVEHDVSNQ